MKNDFLRVMYKGRFAMGETRAQQLSNFKSAISNPENLLMASVFVNTVLFFTYYKMTGYQAIVIDQHSMSPTLRHGDHVLVKMFNRGMLFRDDTTHVSNIKRGDIVVYKHPKFPDKLEVKRVIGLYRDVVTPVRSTLQVHLEPEPVKVPQGYMFVEGDNMTGNRRQDDSNRFGCIPLGLAEGVLIKKIEFSVYDLKFWPFVSNIDRAAPKKRVEFDSKFFPKFKQNKLVDLKHEDSIEPGINIKANNDIMLMHLQHAKERAADKYKVSGKSDLPSTLAYRQGQKEEMKEEVELVSAASPYKKDTNYNAAHDQK